MSSFDKGLDAGLSLMKWLLDITGGILGFITPFAVAVIAIAGLGVGVMLIFSKGGE